VQFMRSCKPADLANCDRAYSILYMALFLYISALTLWAIGIRHAMRKPKW
jgi:hypothetical protein